MAMAKLYCLMGKSASGKDTFYKDLMEEEKLHLKTVVSYTTRPPREGEKDGVEYHFVSRQQLEDYDQAGKVIECRNYPTVHGIWSYFTVDDGQIDPKGQQDMLIIGTLESYEKLRDYFGKEYVEPIYIHVEDGERLMRALLRERQQEQPKYAEMCRRYLADEKDFSQENLEKCEITEIYENSNYENCLQQIIRNIEAHHKNVV